MNTPLKDDSPMPIGRDHKGKPLSTVPADYLLWIYDQQWFSKSSPLGLYIAGNMQGLKKERKGRNRQTN